MQHGTPAQQRYHVLVDDNFHYMDEEYRYERGTFPECASAVAACKAIVDEFLLDNYRPGMTAPQLWDLYVGFGEDPWIATDDAGCQFSAWEYAKGRANDICQRRP